MAKVEVDTYKLFGLKPACEDMSRQEVTSTINRCLVDRRLNRKNAYSYWAHEVEVARNFANPDLPDMRIDFLQFEPAYYHTCTAASAIERGTFIVYEVKSCPEDLKSGHGLNFIGDENYLVFPVEYFEKFNELLYDDANLRKTCRCADYLLFGKQRNGYLGFKEVEHSQFGKEHRQPRTKSASELLLCMIRALLANSNHSDVEHQIKQEVN